MPSSRSPRLLAFALLGGLLSGTGCAHVATVRCWQPPALDVQGIQRVAVVDFCGEHGADVAAALQNRLRESECYALVDASELTTLQHAAYTPGHCDPAVLTQARERGIDAVICGEVNGYESPDAATTGGSSPEVTVTLRLVDVQTGEVRAEQQATHQASDHAAGPAQTPADRDIELAQLTGECLDDLLALLAPHAADKAMPLACGRWYTRDAAAVRHGNRLAAVGNWDAARELWQGALERRPESDAALFNLAIDAAHRQQFDRAEELAMQALRIRHTDQYAAGLARIRASRTSFDSVARQRDRRVLQAAVGNAAR